MNFSLSMLEALTLNTQYKRAVIETIDSNGTMKESDLKNDMDCCIKCIARFLRKEVSDGSLGNLLNKLHHATRGSPAYEIIEERIIQCCK